LLVVSFKNTKNILKASILCAAKDTKDTKDTKNKSWA